MSKDKVTDNASDDVVVEDGAGRRRFMRRGATFVAVAGAAATSVGRSALASDCDRGGPGGKKPEYAGNGSDSDKGASADPTGCGRRQEEAPKISMSTPNSEAGETKPITIAKVSG